MPEVCSLIWLALVGAFRSRVSLEAENTILRHQLNVLRRQSPKRPTFGMLDRLIFAGLYRLAPKLLGALAIVKPGTVIKWHRAGFRSYWRWKSRHRGGRPAVAPEIRKLIRENCIANSLWGSPRIHAGLLKLGIDIGQTSVAKYMAKRRDPPSQGWRTFLRNHADGIAAMDMFVVPTISFRLLEWRSNCGIVSLCCASSQSYQLYRIAFPLQCRRGSSFWNAAKARSVLRENRTSCGVSYSLTARASSTGFDGAPEGGGAASCQTATFHQKLECWRTQRTRPRDLI